MDITRMRNLGMRYYALRKELREIDTGRITMRAIDRRIQIRKELKPIECEIAQFRSQMHMRDEHSGHLILTAGSKLHARMKRV